MSDSLAPAGSAQMVPGDFAEKAMASLMSLHSELMDEKERRVELYRKLMEREQTVAELRMYIRLLEEKVETKPPAMQMPPPLPEPVLRAAPPIVPTPPRPAPATPHTLEPRIAPPMAPRVARPRVDGWKTW